MTAQNVHTLDSSSFQDAVAGSVGPVLVDFHAEWCPPCQVLAPTIDALADAYAGRALIGKVDVDANKELASEFDVRTIPTILVFRDGRVVQHLPGVKSQGELAEALDDAGATVAA